MSEHKLSRREFIRMAGIAASASIGSLHVTGNSHHSHSGCAHGNDNTYPHATPHTHR